MSLQEGLYRFDCNSLMQVASREGDRILVKREGSQQGAIELRLRPQAALVRIIEKGGISIPPTDINVGDRIAFWGYPGGTQQPTFLASQVWVSKIQKPLIRISMIVKKNLPPMTISSIGQNEIYVYTRDFKYGITQPSELDLRQYIIDPDGIDADGNPNTNVASIEGDPNSDIFEVPRGGFIMRPRSTRNILSVQGLNVPPTPGQVNSVVFYVTAYDREGNHTLFRVTVTRDQ